MDSDPTNEAPLQSLFLSSTSSAKITSWSVTPGDKVRRGVPLLTYSLDKNVPDLQSDDDSKVTKMKEGMSLQLKSTLVGVVREALYEVGVIVPPSAPVVTIEKRCDHSVVAYDLCADCGVNLKEYGTSAGATTKPRPPTDRISMIHGIPEIRISRKEAEVLANKDKLHLLQNRKLALIVDLDQTLIHTSVNHNIEPGLPDVYGFKLPGHPVIYHCRLRPYARQFLQNVSKYYETHVFTMGTKLYAASVTHILDPDKKMFYGRIISRDDCFDPHSKALRLKSVFPCGDAMVAIIDDREDVWGRCPNLIHVKPYIFFAGTADINAPPGSQNSPSTPSRQVHTHPTPQQQNKHTDTNPLPTADHPEELESKQQKDEPYRMKVDKKENEGVELGSESRGESLHGSGNHKPHPHTCREEVLHHNEAVTSEELVSESPPSLHPASLDDSSTMNPDKKQVTLGPEKEEPNSSSSSTSNSDSDSEDSSSSSSSDVDDTLFDSLEKEGENKVVPSPTKTETVEHLNCQKDHTIQKSPDTETKCAPTTEGDPGTDLALQEGQVATAIKKATAITEQEMKTDKTNTADHQLSDLEQLLLSPTTSPAEPSDKETPRIHDSDNFLLHLTDILERVHKTFYSEYDHTNMQSADPYMPDLKQIIPKLRQSVLKGTKILFTGVIPTNVPPEKVPEWNTARAFGASIHDRLVPGLTSSNLRKLMQATTHVVAGKPGTSKLREAKRIPGMKIVSPKWLWACAEQWRLVDERLFPPEFEHKDQAGRKPQPKIPKVDRSEAADKNLTETHVLPKKRGHVLDDVFADSVYSSESVKDTNSHDASAMREKLREIHRHLSIESRLSVSDEELEKMNAEVDAEIDGSTSSEEETGMAVDELGSLIEAVDDDESLSYDSFAGMSESQTQQLHASRKRKHADVENSSSSNSPVSLDLLNESLGQSDEESDSGEEDSGDELAALLGNT